MIKNGIKNLYQKGFFHILTSSILNKIMIFCSGMFIVRFLTKNDFGIYSYVQNLLSFFLLLNGFGINGGFIQYGSKENEKIKEGLSIYCLKYGFSINVFLSAIIILYSYFGDFKIEEARIIFRLMAFLPNFTFLIELLQIDLRVNLKNKEMSVLLNLNTFFNLIGMVLGAKLSGLYGMILGKYIGNIMTLVLYSKSYYKILLRNDKLINFKLKQRVKKFSKINMLNNGISQFLYLMDIFFIGLILKDKNIIASYKTATLIPFALNFIPLSVITYLYPYLVKKSNDTLGLKKYVKDLLKYLGIVNFLIVVCGIILSEYIIIYIFGREYVDSIIYFKLLMIGYFFIGTFRIPFINILTAIGKLKYNLFITILSGVLNIVLNIILIKKYGSMGAVITTLSVFIFSSIISGIFLLKYFMFKNK